MSRILWLPAGDYESRSAFDYETNSFVGGGSTRNPAGVRIDDTTALNSTVVLACIRVLAEGLASLPLHVYKRLPDGGKEVARNHPLYRVLHYSPNDWQTSFEWREMLMLHLGIYGQSFCEVVLDAKDIIQELVPLHPSRMRCESIETGRIRYTYQEESGRLTTYSQDQVMHIRWMSNDGVNGMVPIELARDAIGLARACEIHGASFFANGARPGLVLSTDTTLSPEAAEMLRNNWERVHRGPDRAAKTAVLTGGLKPIEFGSTNQESQYLETRRFQIEEICRLYRVPPHLVGDLTRSSFSNIEQQSIDFVQHTLLPWLRRFESAFARDLLGDSDTYFVEFDTRGLMRGDASTRAAYYSTLHSLGIASVNELRAWENLNPVEGGDLRFTPLNMQTLSAAAAKAEEKEPPATVSELVSVLGQVAGGSIDPAAAKAVMDAVFPTLDSGLADKILAGVSPPKEEPPPPDKPADVGGIVAILSQVKDGSLSTEGAVAALGSVYPGLSRESATQIVSGVSKPPEQPEPAAADVGGLLAILAQVSQGAVTQEAALSIVTAVYPAMPKELAEAIVEGAKQQQPEPEPPGEPTERAKPGTIAEGDFVSWNSAGGRTRGRVDHVMDYGTLDVPDTDLKVDASEEDPAALITVYEKVTGGWQATGTQVGHKVATLTKIDPLEAPADKRAFCPGASPPDNSCSPSNKSEGDGGTTVSVSDVSVDSVFEQELHFKTDGGIIKIAKSKWSPADWSVIDTFVDEDKRRQGIASRLIEKVKQELSGSISAQASSDNSAALFWRHGFRLPDGGTLDDARRRREEDSSVLLVYDPKKNKTQQSKRAFCPTGPGGGVDNSCSAADKGSEPGRVPSSDYGMEYSPGNAQVVSKAREVSDEAWNTLPVTTLPHGTKLHANEKTLKTAPIEKVVSGREPFREGYVTKLWKTPSGELHIVDGHHRVAMYHALGKDMPVRIMSDKEYGRLGSRAFCPTGPGGGVDNSCSPGEGKGARADVTVETLRSHADRVSDGSYIDGSLRTSDFPDGAVVPKNFQKLKEHHAKVKADLADRIGVASDNSATMSNSATTVEDLLKDAREAAPVFKSLIDEAARASGSEPSLGESDSPYLKEHAFGTHMLKMPEAVEGKVPRLAKKHGIDPADTPAIVSQHVNDAVRGTLISDTPESLGDAVRSVRDQLREKGLEPRIENKFENSDETGYGAVHMELPVRTPSGREVMAELQFHLRQAYDGNQGSPKDNSHGLYKQDPKTQRVSTESSAAQMLIWSRTFEDVPPRGKSRRSSRAFCATGEGGGVDNSCPPKSSGGGSDKCPDPCYTPDPTKDTDKDGVTDAAIVGVAAKEVPPPPKIGRLPNLNEYERSVEEAFASAYEKDPDGMAAKYREAEVARGTPPTFATDDAKQLADQWSHPDPEVRAQNRATLNTVLHQTANAIAKKAFLQHLDTLEEGSEVLVTVGGCGAGKGFALKNVPEALDARGRAAAVWDSAGDQNATENPWIQEEAEKRGLKVNYVYVHADPQVQWADPDRGVVARAGNPNDGRMVDARVFADSYAVGARNHQAFYEKNRDNPNASFVFLDNTAKPTRIDGIPPAALNLDSDRLAFFAERTVVSAQVPDRVKSGALKGRRIWRKS